MRGAWYLKTAPSLLQFYTYSAFAGLRCLLCCDGKCIGCLAWYGKSLSFHFFFLFFSSMEEARLMQGKMLISQAGRSHAVDKASLCRDEYAM